MLQNSLLAVKWYPVLFDSPMNITRAIFFWLTVALVIGFAIGVFPLKDEARKKFLRYSLFAGVGYACLVSIVLLAFTFSEDGITAMTFWPLAVLCVAVAASALLLCFKRNKLTFIIAGCIVGAALIAVLVCMGIYYAQNVDGDGYYNSDAATVNQVILYLAAVVLLLVIIGGGFLFDKGRKGFDSKSIAYAAICIAMSFALSYLRIVKLPQGGSVTIASLLPLMIYSYVFGTKKGVFAGFIYGLLQALQDPWIIHPAQFLLDYPVAFSAIGLAGLFANVKPLEKLPQLKFALGAIVASVLRFASHVLSGVFAFAAYAVDAGMAPWPYSLAYNSFVFVDIIIVLVAGVLLFSSRAFMSQVKRINQVKTPVEVSDEE